MNLLREYIRALLTEAAMGPADLPSDAYVVIRVKSMGTAVFYAFADGSMRSDAGPPSGWVRFSTGGSPTGECLGANVVVESQSDSGWGPLLYDVAMEESGDKGLMADRMSLSSEAFNVWKVYMSRGDVQQKQLDTLDNELTPGEDDNCGTDTALSFDDTFDDYRSDEKKQALADSPVMKVFTKGPTTIEKLESMGRLIRK